MTPRGLGLAGIKVVLGAHGARITQAIDPRGVELIHHPRWQEGQSSSLRAGLLSLPLGVHSFITPVDCPPVANETIEAMVKASQGTWDMVQPTYDGKGGHPVLLSAETIQGFLTQAPPPPLNQFLRAHAPRKRQVEVKDPGVLWNLNRPSDLLAYQRTFQG